MRKKNQIRIRKLKKINNGTYPFLVFLPCPLSHIVMNLDLELLFSSHVSFCDYVSDMATITARLMIFGMPLYKQWYLISTVFVSALYCHALIIDGIFCITNMLKFSYFKLITCIQLTKDQKGKTYLSNIKFINCTFLYSCIFSYLDFQYQSFLS